MSQDGYLSEAELSSYFNQYLGLKLDKEDIIRPTREGVTQIYSSFLDFVGCDWRNKFPEHEPTNLTLLRRALRPFFSHYNEHEFGLYDIVKPVRKRTHYFMVVILSHIVNFMDIQSYWEQLSSESEKNQDLILKLREQIELEQQQLDQMALVIGSHNPDQDESIINQKKANIARLDAQGVELKEEYDNLKSVVEKMTRDHQQRDVEIEELRRELKSKQLRIEMKAEESRLKERLERLMNDLDQKKARNIQQGCQITEHLESLNRDRIEFQAQMDTKMETLTAQNKKIKEGRIELEKRRSDRLKEAKEFEDYMDKAITNLTRKHEKSMKLTDKLQTAATNYNTRIRSHFVQASKPDTNINRTFTKSTAN